MNVAGGPAVSTMKTALVEVTKTTEETFFVTTLQ